MLFFVLRGICTTHSARRSWGPTLSDCPRGTDTMRMSASKPAAWFGPRGASGRRVLTVPKRRNGGGAVPTGSPLPWIGHAVLLPCHRYVVDRNCIGHRWFLACNVPARFSRTNRSDHKAGTALRRVAEFFEVSVYRAALGRDLADKSMCLSACYICTVNSRHG